jgi:poly(A) polymerase
LPAYVKEALQKLDEAGHLAYVVGGCVRDFLLGRDCKDYDIATGANPDEICELFPNGVTVGKAFGVIKVPTGIQPPLLEIATFREDLDYTDHRHPKGVLFSGPVQDAQRRDFTINALFYDPKTQRILDSTGGLEDLKLGILRAIGNPSERFREDALRLLRAIRFKTRFGFKIDPDTSEAIRARARLVSKVSSERIRDELTLMWQGPHPEESLKLLSEYGLLSLVLPEVEALKGVAQIPSYHRHEDVWAHLLKMLAYMAEQSPVRSATVSWAAVLHEVGKPVASELNGGKNFNNHEIESVRLTEKIATRLKMSRADCDRIVAMVADHLKFRDVFQMRESTLQRLIRQEHFEELLAFHKADAGASDGNLAYYEFCANRLETLKKSLTTDIQKLVDGKDLIQLGFLPGPEFSEILRVVEDLTLEKKLTTKEEALEYVIKNFVR